MKDEFVIINYTAFKKYCEELGDTPLQKVTIYAVEGFIVKDEKVALKELLNRNK